jgi:hypothetical protein
MVAMSGVSSSTSTNQWWLNEAALCRHDTSATCVLESAAQDNLSLQARTDALKAVPGPGGAAAPHHVCIWR